MAEKRPKPTRDPKKGIAIARWENEGGALREKKPKRPRDMNQWAKRMVDIATGDVEDREPTPEEQVKDPAAVERGRAGGAIGGRVRATSLSKQRRTEIARKAAKSRWKTSAHSE